jgi:queuine tRNA-ribosyltransferase
LSIRWARRSKEAFEARPGRGIFAIVQGGTDTDLRVECAESLVEIGFDGYAVGGLAVGEARAAMFETLEATLPVLPAEAPRYLMGVGKPDDIVEAVRRGIDMFDCVLPTRSGRTAQAFTRRGEVNLRNARHADDPRPLDEACTCPTCARWSRAYLHHLVKADEILAPMALTRHNLHYYQDLMRDLRDAIKEGKLAVRADKILETRAAGDIAPV